MRFFASPARLRLGVAALLASLLPLAVQAALPGGPSGEGQPARWLEAQVQRTAAAPSPRRAAQATFDRALARAKADDTRTLHAFLAAFLDAHARLTEAPAPQTQGRSCQALIQEVRRRLVRAGLVVHPPMQASAPPAAPERLGRWVAASLLGPSLDRSAISAAGKAPSARPYFQPAHVAGAAAPFVVGGDLLRALFAGRSLGP